LYNKEHEALSYPEHLICINKHFYYRISIPVDLKHYFPATIIQKTLRTTNIKDAKPLLLAAEYKVQRVFAQLRIGMLPVDVPIAVSFSLLPHRKANHTDQTAAIVFFAVL
jgi:hypothetical protein